MDPIRDVMPIAIGHAGLAIGGRASRRSGHTAGSFGQGKFRCGHPRLLGGALGLRRELQERRRPTCGVARRLAISDERS